MFAVAKSEKTSSNEMNAGQDELDDAPADAGGGGMSMTREDDEAATPSGGLLDKLRSWTRLQLLMIATIAIAECAGFASLSVIAPFFPPLAASKGMRKNTIGLVFSSFAFAGFISAPLAGLLVPKIGIKIMLVGSVLSAGAATICFGMLKDIQDEGWFSAGAFGFRMLQGFSFSFFLTAVFSIATTIFQSQMGLILSILEMMVGIGISIGPPIGSGLFAVGGYKLPFIFLGVVLCITAVPLIFVLPSTKEFLKWHEDLMQKSDSSVKRKSMWKLVVSYEPMLVLCTIVVASISYIYYHSILQPFLEEKFGTRETEAGFVFLASLGSYCLTIPLSGILSDFYPQYKYLQIMAGLAWASLGSLMVGPAPFLLPVLPRNLVTTIVGLVFAGSGVSMATVPTFQGFTDVTIAAGFPADMKTFGMTSALWNSAWALGECIGPAIASGMSDLLDDYVLSFLVNSCITMAMTGILLFHFLFHVRRRRKKGSRSGTAVGGSKAITASSSVNNDHYEAGGTTTGRPASSHHRGIDGVADDRRVDDDVTAHYLEQS